MMNLLRVLQQPLPRRERAEDARLLLAHLGAHRVAMWAHMAAAWAAGGETGLLLAHVRRGVARGKLHEEAGVRDKDDRVVRRVLKLRKDLLHARLVLPIGLRQRVPPGALDLGQRELQLLEGPHARLVLRILELAQPVESTAILTKHHGGYSLSKNSVELYDSLWLY